MIISIMMVMTACRPQVHVSSARTSVSESVEKWFLQFAREYQGRQQQTELSRVAQQLTAYRAQRHR
jgi:hypothetical protein